MAAAGITAGRNVYQSVQKDDSLRQSLRSFKQLADSLKSSDLEGARKAFTSLQQSLQQGTGQTQSGDQNSTRGGPQITMLQQLGKALDAGDLAGAQKMFENLMRSGSSTTGNSEISSSGSSGYTAEISAPASGGKINVIV